MKKTKTLYFFLLKKVILYYNSFFLKDTNNTYSAIMRINLWKFQLNWSSKFQGFDLSKVQNPEKWVACMGLPLV